MSTLIKDQPRLKDQPRRSGDLHIETLRGLAVILMVAGHVIGASPDVGMRVDDASIWRSCYDSLLFLRMPLFTVLSGAVYAMRPVTPGTGRRFLQGKVRRLLVPAIVVGGAFYITQALIPGVNSPPELSEIWQVAVYSYAHFWFLHALLLIFLLIVALELAGALASFRAWLVCTAISFAAAAANWNPSPIFALNSAIYMLPFFLWGLGICRFRAAFDRRDVTLGIAVVAVAARQLTLHGVLHLPVGRQDPLTLVAGLAGCALLLHFRFSISWLAKVGAFSYGIFLLHVFGTGGSRIVLAKAGISSEIVHFTIGLIAGIAFSIVAELILSKSAIARALPDAEEVIAYKMPGFRIGKSIIAGYAAFSKQCGLYLAPSAIKSHADDIAAAGLKSTKTGVTFSPSQPIPDALVKKLALASRKDLNL